MTKTEFRTEAGKAGIYPELYGAVLSKQFHHTDLGWVSGGKVVGIEWLDEWQTKEEYSCMMGTHTVTSMGKSPYVVLTKNRVRYLVEAWRIQAYVDDQVRKWITEKVKNKESF